MSKPKIKWDSVVELDRYRFPQGTIMLTNVSFVWPGASSEEITRILGRFEAVINVHEEPEATFETTDFKPPNERE
jgi:hypothetical protein